MFYGWRIVSGVFIAQLFIIGFMTYSFGLFMVPLQDEFGASRAQVNLGMTAVTVAGLILSPVIGSLVDRMSIRVLMTAGAVIFAAGLYGMSLSQSIWHFVVIFGISVSFGSLLLGPLTGSTTVSRWFSKKRGQALGIAAVGTSVGGLLLPVVIGDWIAEAGWRNALLYLSYVVILFVLPLMILVIRSHPSELGMYPDGAEANDSNESAVPAIDLKAILRHPAYWTIGLSIGLIFSVYSALMANLVPYAEDTGITLEAASLLMGVIAGFGLAGKIIFGMAADKISLRLGLWIAIALILVGLGILLLEPSYALTVVACAVIGLASGGMLPVWGAMLAVVFGVASYGKVMGLMNPLITLLVMPSFVITGYIHDLTGSYSNAFWLYCGLLVVSALILFRLKMPASSAAASN